MAQELYASARVDVWLWCVRAYRTRQLAKQACLAGHVSVAGRKAKPAATIRVGQPISLTTPRGKRTLTVLAIPPSRISAANVPTFALDTSPQVSPGQPGSLREQTGVWREQGMGRPTKKDRRSIEQWRKDATY